MNSQLAASGASSNDLAHGFTCGLTRCLAAAFAFVCISATADEVTPTTAQVAQRVRDELQQTLVRLAANGELGTAPENFSLSVDVPAHSVSNLGLLVDSASAEGARTGLKVLGATPGSAAEKLGLHAGDIVTAVNGTTLRALGADASGRALAAATLRTAVDALGTGATLQLDVQRGSEVLVLHTESANVRVPALHLRVGPSSAGAANDPGNAARPVVADAGCGRINVFDVAPRGDHLYAARVLLIDGVTPGPSWQTSYRVSVGEHRLLIGEEIPIRQFGVGDFSTFRRNTHKELTVVIKSGTTAMIAAQFHPDKASELLKGNYWNPIVWREVAESCP